MAKPRNYMVLCFKHFFLINTLFQILAQLKNIIIYKLYIMLKKYLNLKTNPKYFILFRGRWCHDHKNIILYNMAPSVQQNMFKRYEVRNRKSSYNISVYVL